MPCSGSDLLVGERQLLPGAPLVGHVVDDDLLAHTLDLARLKAVVGDVGGNEDHCRVAGKG